MKKGLIVILVLLLFCAVGFGVYHYRSSYLFNEDGTVSDGHQELINRLKEVDDDEEKNKQIDFSLQQNLITEEEANELRK